MCMYSKLDACNVRFSRIVQSGHNKLDLEKLQENFLTMHFLLVSFCMIFCMSLSPKGCLQPGENKICILSVPVCLSVCLVRHSMLSGLREFRSVYGLEILEIPFVSVLAKSLCETQLSAEDRSLGKDLL